MSDTERPALTDHDLALMVDPSYLDSADSEDLGNDLCLVVAELLKVRQGKADLLAACEEFISVCDSNATDYSPSVDMKRIREAVAKAEGETQ